MGEGGEREEVGGYVFADGGVGTAACFDGLGKGSQWGLLVLSGRIGLGWWGVGVVNLDAFGRESVVLGEELGVFSTSTARNISERRADTGGGIEAHTA